MPKNVRAPRPNEINQLVAVNVKQVRSVSSIDDQRAAANTSERTSRAVDPTRNQLLSFREMGQTLLS